MITQEKIHTLGMHVLIQLKGTDTFLFLLRSDYKDRDALHRDLIWWWLEFGEDMQNAIYREMDEEVWIKLLDKEKETLTIIWTYHERRDPKKTKWWTAILYHILIDPKEIKLSHEHTEYQRLTLEEAKKLEPTREIVGKAIALIR